MLQIDIISRMCLGKNFSFTNSSKKNCFTKVLEAIKYFLKTFGGGGISNQIPHFLAT